MLYILYIDMSYKLKNKKRIIVSGVRTKSSTAKTEDTNVAEPLKSQ